MRNIEQCNYYRVPRIRQELERKMVNKNAPPAIACEEDGHVSRPCSLDALKRV